MSVCSPVTDQQGEHLQHGDLSVDQVRQEVDEGGNAEPVTETRSYGCSHQGSLPLQHTRTHISYVRGPQRVSVCVRALTMTVPDVFMPCSRIATRVKTSIRGPYSSPAIFYTQGVQTVRGPELELTSSYRRLRKQLLF